MEGERWTTAPKPRSVDGLTILIDSNIFIALEEVGLSRDEHSSSAAQFASLATRLGARIAVCAATHEDILRAPEDKRRARQKQLGKYFLLSAVPPNLGLARAAGFPPVRTRNDEVDLSVLTALAAGAVDWLVTQDIDLRKRATRAGLRESVFSLQEILETLDSFLNKPSGLTTVATVAGYQIAPTASIFESLRTDYPGFDQWWKGKVAKEHRDVLILGSMTDPEGLAVLKIEEDRPHGIPGRVLKICTFKTAEQFQGSKRGELLLRAAIDYARRNDCERTYLEVLPSKESLLSWLPEFGFAVAMEAATSRGEHVVVKQLVSVAVAGPLSALDYNIAYGPGALRAESVHLVPIQAQFHRRLFPDAELQPTLFPRLEACGNAIRKAYLSHAKIRSIRAGDVLIFLRTGVNTAATAVGVAEETRVTRIPEDIATFVGRRTVYLFDEIVNLCEKGDTLTILFRLDRVLKSRWTIDELRNAGVLKRSPQSIQRVPEDSIEWIQQRLEE